MQVVSASAGMAICLHAGDQRTVRTSLLGDVQPGDWLLVFQSDAVEHIDAQRASEVLATLALVQNAMTGGAVDGLASFELPSSTPAMAWQHLTG